MNARLGDATGADVGAGAHVGRIGAGAGVGAALGDDGLDAAVSTRADVGRLAGVHAGGHLGLDDDSEVAVAAGGHLGDLGVGTTAGVYTDGGLRPDITLGGRAGDQHGVLDLNPPIGYPEERATPASDAATTVQPLPPVKAPDAAKPTYEAATPENFARVQSEIRTKLWQQDKYTVQKGDTYESIASKLLPGTDAASPRKQPSSKR